MSVSAVSSSTRVFSALRDAPEDDCLGITAAKADGLLVCCPGTKSGLCLVESIGAMVPRI